MFRQQLFKHIIAELWHGLHTLAENHSKYIIIKPNVMKKLMLLGAAIAMLSVTACKKDYTCACTVSTGNIDLEFENAKKQDAEDACQAAEDTYKILDPNASCSL